MKKVITSLPEETISFAENFAKELKPNTVIALTGQLGAGKTTFTKGIAQALGVKEPITSPTFTLIQEYEGEQMPMFHMDLYRLESVEEFEMLGAEDYFFRNGITLIEWSEKAEEILPTNTIYIHFELNSQGNREINITTPGEHK